MMIFLMNKWMIVWIKYEMNFSLKKTVIPRYIRKERVTTKFRNMALISTNQHLNMDRALFFVLYVYMFFT